MPDIPASWSLAGKIAIVTGAARGIGLATTTLLRERGARIVATDRSDARGNFLHAREAMKVMADGGSIISVASISSIVGFATQAAYASSKGALAQLMRVIAIEGGKRGIRSNAVAPGVIETDIMEGVVEGD